MNAFAPRIARKQQGAALIMVLILLLVMTLLALAAVRGTSLRERLSGNAYDRSLAFQAAEAALREGELKAIATADQTAGALATPALGTCAKGFCCMPKASATPVWEDEAAWTQAATVNTLSVNLGSMVVKPVYIIELLAPLMKSVSTGSGSGVKDLSDSGNSATSEEHIYRVTARSQEDGRAAVMLQSTFAVAANPAQTVTSYCGLSAI